MKMFSANSLTFFVKEPTDRPAKGTIFYFSLSAEDSLSLPPFCHPVDSLLKQGISVISTTLPHHEDNARPYGISELWQKDKHILKEFIERLQKSIEEIKKQYSPPFGAMGLSRGAFIALHLASECKDIYSICCFAPMLSLKDDLDLSLPTLVSKLLSKNIHIFIGDNDTLVNTSKVIAFGHEIEAKVTVYPSIGRSGHGTPDEQFEKGATWLSMNL
jgi:predicted esterase